MFYKISLIYLIFINLISAFVCVIDKFQAKNGGWRISERALFTLVILGGGVGMYGTMQTIRHKTKHKRFMIGIPLIMFLQILLIYLICSKIL